MDLNQILEQVTRTKEQHQADIEVAAKELEAVQQQIKEAAEAAEAAAAAGDPDAYAREKQREDYNRKRAEALARKKIAPSYTEQEYRELVEQTRKQVNDEVRPLYKRLYDISVEWKEICAQISGKDSITWKINQVMQSDVGYEVYRSYNTPYVYESYSPSTGDAISHYVIDLAKRYSQEV